MEVVFLDANTVNPGDLDFRDLDSLGNVKLYPHTSPEDIITRASNAEIIITNKVPLSRETLRQLPRLKYITLAATGYNNVDIQAAREKGVVVSNVSGYSTLSVAQHVFSMLLRYLNDTATYNQEVATGRWSDQIQFSYWNKPIQELSSMTIGIIGLGTIGRRVAQIALSFDMNVIAIKRSSYKSMKGIEWVDLHTLYRNADVISLHAPLNDSTHHMINKASISMMKPSAILINTARGGHINEVELATALRDHTIAAALLDVLSQEPPPKDHPLLGIPNCYITPHQAWASVSSRKRLLKGIVNNIQHFLQGHPVNVVN